MRANKTNHYLLRGIYWRLLSTLALLLLMSFVMRLSYAASIDHSNKLIQYLAQEKLNLTLATSDIKRQSLPVSEADYARLWQENQAKIALIRAKISSFESFLINQKKLQLDFNLKIKQLQQSPAASLPPISAQAKIERINFLNEINKKTIDLLNENLTLATHYQELLTEQSQSLGLWKSHARMLNELANLHKQEDKLNESLSKLYENSLQLQQKLKLSTDFKSTYALDARLLLNNQVINLTQHKITALNLQRKLAQADFLLLKNPDIRTLQKVTEIYKNTINQLSDMEQSLKKMVLMLKNEQLHVTDGALKEQFIALTHIITARISEISIQEQTLQEDLENHQQELNKQLSVRLNLSEYRMDTWPIISQQLVRIPGQLYTYIKLLFLKVKDNYLWKDTLPALMVWCLLVMVSFIFFMLHRLLKRLTQDKERSRLSGHLYGGFLTLISRNLLGLFIINGLWVIFYLNEIPYVSYQLLFNLIFVWLTFRTFIMIAHLGLMERISDSSGRDVRFYYRIKWLLLAGGWSTALMVFSHELPLSLLLQDTFNRLFMFFLVGVSLVGWRSQEVITHLLHPLLKSKKRYLRNAILLLIILTPLTLFIIALIGLVGYMNLAWTMSSYQVQILLIITIYVLIRGLLFDALELISEWMISSLRNGWLWIEVFLKPTDKILRVLLIVFSLFLLSTLFDWHSDSTVIAFFQRISVYPLVNLSGIHITALSILEFFIISSCFVWIAKWTREFCFRWLYRETTDAGIRNSLSVFTQYAVILVGGFITLRVLGFDFSGMSMIIGGLAVGMGFGLRDFASNIVGGLMLLIERPVREGDLITLGNYEGRVAHIGIRTMRVSSWDNMEVLIPNAETFNKPFTNWTHQDSIVRTVIPVKVSRLDDPVMVQQLILDVLTIIPEIVDEPPPQVFLKQIDEALIEFEVRYFINVQIYTRFEIRSKVLFAIMAQFNAAGIKPPIPPFSVEIKELSHEASLAQFFPEQ